MPTKNALKKPARKAVARPSAPAAKTTLPMTKTPATKPALPQPAAAKAPAAQSPAPAARLTLAAVMGLLEQLGSEQTRKTWVRHGAQGPMFGVLFGELFKLMKRIGVDHELARALWATGNVDARNLAMKIADPLAMTSDELDRWALEYEMGMCGLYIASLAAEGPHGAAKVREWLSSPHERLRGEGWTLLGRLSDLDETFSEAELRRRVAEIEQTIHAAPNVTRSKMNQALIAIGGHSPALREAVLAAAKRIGPVTVDHGDTSCKTPNAVEYVAKMWERAGKKYPSPAAHQRSLGSMRRRC